jgi:hypothetical protein
MPRAWHAFAIDVLSASAPEPLKRRAVASRSSLGPIDASSASASTSGSSTQRALRVLDTLARSRTRRRGSS